MSNLFYYQLDEINKELGPLEELIEGVNEDISKITDLCGNVSKPNLFAFEVFESNK